MHRWIKDYFSFTKKERNAVLILVVLILFITLLPYLIPQKTDHADTAALKQFQQQIASLKPVQKDSFRTSGYNDKKQPFNYGRYLPGKANAAVRLFYFDPNTLPEEGWKKLGLTETTARTIRHYLEKGGRFRKPGDIGKIYSMRKTDVERLLPYVRLNQPAEPDPVAQKEKAGGNSYTRSFRPLYNKLIIDINHTDTTTLQLLPGIGSKLAARIISFKEKLGGFYTVDQVAETYGLPDSTFQKIKPHLAVIQQGITTVNINTSDADQLKQHPYIRWNIANAIVQYRVQHGNFKNKEDLLQIAVISPEVYKKLSPYISIE